MKDEVQAAVVAFFERLSEGDVEDVWRLVAPNLRLALVQNVIWHTQDRRAILSGAFDDVAAGLADESPNSPDWPSMQRGLLRTLVDAYGHIDLNHWGPTRARPVAVDSEAVLLLDRRDGEVWEPGTYRRATSVIVSFDPDAREWRVSGLGRLPAEPGWPPDTHPGAVEWD